MADVDGDTLDLQMFQPEKNQNNGDTRDDEMFQPNLQDLEPQHVTQTTDPPTGGGGGAPGHRENPPLPRQT